MSTYENLDNMEPQVGIFIKSEEIEVENGDADILETTDSESCNEDREDSVYNQIKNSLKEKKEEEAENNTSLEAEKQKKSKLMDVSKRMVRATAQQISLLVSLMKTDPYLAQGKTGKNVSKRDIIKRWQAIADNLNLCGHGPVKTVSQWRKCWNDQKGYARAKALKLKLTTNITDKEKLSELEETILQISGDNLILGDEQVQERGVPSTSKDIQLSSSSENRAAPIIEKITFVPDLDNPSSSTSSSVPNHPTSNPTPAPRPVGFASQKPKSPRIRDRRTSLRIAQEAAKDFINIVNKQNTFLERMAIAAEQQASETKKQTEIFERILGVMELALCK